MTGPINRPASTTPDPSVHRAPDSSLNKFAFEIQYLEAVGQKMLQAFLQIVVQAILGLVTGKDLPALQAQLSNWATALTTTAEGAAGNIAALIDGTLGLGHTIEDLVAHFNAFPGELISGATAIEQQIIDILNKLLNGLGIPGQPVNALQQSVTGSLQGMLSSFINNFDGTANALASLIINHNGTALATFEAQLTAPLSAAIDNLDGTVGALQDLITPGNGTAFFAPPSTMNPLAALIDAADGTAMSIASGLQNLVNPVGTANYASSNWQTLLGNTGLSSANQLSSSLQGLIPAALDQFDGTALGIGTQIVQNLDGTATFLTQSATNAVAALINQADGTAMSVATALQAAVPNANTAVQNLNSVIAGIGGTAITDVNNYLQNVPNTAVLGLTGFGTNIGNTISALSDGVWQGLRAFLGIPSGVGPPQVSSAAQQVRVDLNNATDIATLARTIQAAQAITKQSFLSIDPSADPVFPLSNISGASPTTVPVVATKSVMGAILLPDVSTKESITWLGGPLTNISAVYVNLYKVNKTTGVFGLFHASANVIGSLSNPVSGTAWNFYNLPLINYFDVTPDGTGGTTTTVLGIGDYVVVEIVTIGSGTYNVVGFTNGIPTHTTIFPKGLGASRATGANLFSASASYTAGTTANPSFNITPVAGDNCVMAQFDIFSNTSAVTAVSATYGGAAMTLLSLSANYRSGTFGYLATFGYINSTVGSGGTKAVVLTTTGGGTSGTQCAAIGCAVSYPNVASFRTAQTTSGTTGSPTQTVTPTAGDIIFQAFAGAGSATLSAYSEQTIANLTAASLTDSLAVGNQIGYSTSEVFTATQTSGRWAGVAVPLALTAGTNPLAPTSIASPTYDVSTPWIALAGAAGRSQHAAETVEFETAGSGQTYTIPAWVIDGDYIDIVPVGAGAGGSHAGSRNTTADNSYKAGGAGAWNPIRLRYGSAYDIPTGTTSFTVNVGPGGAAATFPGANLPPVHGSDGANTTVVITGYPTITATGGVKDGTTQTTRAWSGGPFTRGDTPGNTVFQGVTYFGGAFSDGVGNSPGGGGSGGQYSSVAGELDAHAGAPGAVYITAVQN